MDVRFSFDSIAKLLLSPVLRRAGNNTDCSRAETMKVLRLPALRAVDLLCCFHQALHIWRNSRKWKPCGGRCRSTLASIPVTIWSRRVRGSAERETKTAAYVDSSGRSGGPMRRRAQT
ncbi:hypothetical protein AAFF_G00296690 [Aldrovandia affinis]|uniref:Uncharacterized protein n=1 Tax=Aldrovandia affinis TaxID=143900 RepID=A0AAD7WRW0_9TELE|nr:hypothetical protein AAFF_G00296690 [Aldrovandia affinis]